MPFTPGRWSVGRRRTSSQRHRGFASERLQTSDVPRAVGPVVYTLAMTVSQQTGEQVAAEIAALGGQALTVPVDITDAAAVERAAGERLARGPCDVLVNNAGYGDQQERRLQHPATQRTEIDRAPRSGEQAPSTLRYSSRAALSTPDGAARRRRHPPPSQRDARCAGALAAGRPLSQRERRRRTRNQSSSAT